MKYKVGDKVRVRRDLVEDQAYGGCSFVKNMTHLCNKTVTISRVHHEISRYQLTENLTGEYWTDEMLEDAEEEFKLPEKWCIKQCSDLMKWGKTTINRPDKEFDSDRSYYWPIGESLVNWDYGSKGVREEITFDQFKKYVLKNLNPIPVKEDVKFEVGKWYKYSAEYINRKTYAKYSSNQSVGGRFYYDEIITENNGFKKGHNWSILTCNPVLLTDLSEIQQYLPENHPDKIKRKTKKVEDLKYPDAVHCSSKEQHDKVKQFANIRDYEGNYYYLIGAGGRREKPWDGTCGSNPESRTTYTNYEFSAIIFPEEKVEIKHKLSKEELLAEAKRRYPVGTKYKCASNDYSDIFVLSSDDWSNSLLDDVVYAECGKGCLYYKGDWAEIISKPTVEEEVIDVPEYIECIEGFSDYIIPGLIYKVIDKTHVDSIILRCNITSNLSAGSNLYVSAWLFAFKPSTKEAFDKQGKSGVKEKEELVQTGLSQSQACDSCKYYGEECAKRKGCDATGGQHYPKDDLSERYIVAVDPFDSESYSDGTEVGKFPSNKGMGFYEQMEKICMQAYSPMGLISGLYYIPAVPKDCFESDEIYVPIIKTEVKQIKL